ncbi:7166_t:CDS:2 [Funneliformis caledonium]|uniref:7166_t:CDS:1 n=1 Tax=Funneliformis caledonium TaxID=1117310 RepID=A0A9N9CR03_9GLOM|nr:7166_t:CDS:2 [Funneliformis caledonium]
MARTSILSVFRVILTCWLGFQVLKATTLLHFMGRRHGYYDSKVAFVIGVQTIAPPIVVINVVTWFVFWFDKQQSRLRNWRTPERELLWWLWTTGVFGGWLSMFGKLVILRSSFSSEVSLYSLPGIRLFL